MIRKLDSTRDWSDFVSRMVHEFENLIESSPACVEDIVQKLCKHDDSITPVDALRDCLPKVREFDLNALPGQMQRRHYYASIEGQWLICSKSKTQHDAMLFAAQASQVLEKANMMLVPIPREDDKNGQRRHAA